MSDMRPYRTLLQEFVQGRLSSEDFSLAFLRYYKSDDALHSPQQARLLDSLFADIDAFVPEDWLRDPDDLDESDLRERAAVTLQLLQPVGHPSDSDD